MASNDWALLERWVRDRDAEAFAEVARRYAGVVYGACRRVLGDAAEAEDAAQECFLTLAQTRKPPRTNLGAWLHRVAVNKARDRVKSASRRRDRERRYMDEQPVETETPWREIESLVDDAIAKLPEDFREALVAHFMQGHSHAEIADRLGVSRQTVTYRVGKGVEGIRTVLRKSGIPIGAAALTASLAANLAEAAPIALVAAVGKMAVSGVPVAAGGTAALAGLITAKSLLIGIGLCTILGLSWLLLIPETEAPAVPPVQAQSMLEGPAAVADGEPVSVFRPSVLEPVAAEEPVPPEEDGQPVTGMPTTPESDARPGLAIVGSVAEGDSNSGRFTVRVAAPGDKLAPLPIELPQPYFGGTPLDFFSDHLEERTYKPREPFLAPAGATNLALGRPVTGSDEEPNYGLLSFVTDGEKGHETDYVVELDAGVQWIQIDLEQIAEIYATVVWHYHHGERVYFDVVILVSNDPEFTTESYIVFNNDYDDTLGFGAGEDKLYIDTYEGKLVDMRGIHARYVRLYSNENTSDEMNHYVEVEVYGNLVPDE